MEIKDTKIEDPKLTPEQMVALKEYARCYVDLHIAQIELATFLARNPTKLLIGLGILLAIMWSFGFMFGITATQF